MHIARRKMFNREAKKRCDHVQFGKGYYIPTHRAPHRPNQDSSIDVASLFTIESDDEHHKEAQQEQHDIPSEGPRTIHNTSSIYGTRQQRRSKDKHRSRLRRTDQILHRMRQTMPLEYTEEEVVESRDNLWKGMTRPRTGAKPIILHVPAVTHPESLYIPQYRPCSIHHILFQRADLLIEYLQKVSKATITFADSSQCVIGAHPEVWLGPLLATRYLAYIQQWDSVRYTSCKNVAKFVMNLLCEFVHEHM